ncbi:MAG: hypothetical protein ACP5HM_03150 [Anaerolineae bacterium]
MSHEELLQVALRHIAACSECQQRLRGLLLDLARGTEESDTPFCPYAAWLLEYLIVEAQGKAAGPLWRNIADHLATCESCAALYADLKVLQAQAEHGAVPPRYPEPDLTFLRHKSNAASILPPFWHVDTLGRLIVEFSNTLLHRLQMPTYRRAAAGLKSTAAPQVLFEVEICPGDEDLDVTLTAETPPEGEPAFCTLIVEVKIPGRGGWPNLAGTEVILKRGAETLASRLTDAFGKAVFPRIPVCDLPEISVEITPASDPPDPS